MNTYSRSPSTSPSPVITHHHSRLPLLPTTQLLDSIASGAHYSGALQPHRDDPPLHGRRWRARSRDSSAENPEIEAKFKAVMDDLEQIYCCKPTPEIVRRRFKEDATLEHPLFSCSGLQNTAGVLFAMVRFVADSQRVSSRILSAGLSPNHLVYTQTQHYTLRLLGLKREIMSVVFVDLDDDMKIVQLVDQWDGEESSTRWPASYLRKAFAKILSWTTRVPQELRTGHGH